MEESYNTENYENDLEYAPIVSKNSMALSRRTWGIKKTKSAIVDTIIPNSVCLCHYIKL